MNIFDNNLWDVKMKICIEKIGLIRPQFNPKNQKIKDELDWSIDYKNTEFKVIQYNCIFKTFGDFSLDFKLEGVLKLEDFETFVKEDVSYCIINKGFDILMEMVNLTIESSTLIEELENKQSNFLNKNVFGSNLIN